MISLPPLADAVAQPQLGVTGLFVVVLLALLGLSLRGYARLARRTGEGNLWLAPFGVPDVLMAGVLGLWLCIASLPAYFRSVPRSLPVTDQMLVQNALFLGVIILGVLGFLQWRRISFVPLFGLDRMPWLRAVGLGLRYVAMGYPLIFTANLVMSLLLGGGGEQQEILTFFQQAAMDANYRSLLLAGAAGVIVAPLTEEFLFRGYLYGTLRRYLNAPVAIAVNAALFALIHGNIVALPALFVLAVCLCIAYEVTGSLWVPITMHLVFNFVTLAVLYLTIISGIP